MAVVFVTSAVLAALLLSPPGAGADFVTWRKCQGPGHNPFRFLEAPTDSNATMISLESCNLTEVRSGDFDGLPNLDKIALYYNSIAHVDPAAFRTVPKLDWLDLNHNDLREVPDFDEHSFCPSLSVLLLENNRITKFNDPKTFSGCTELKYISLKNNVIEYIHADVFRPLSELKLLRINNNKITAIPETLFINNNKFNFLNIADNKIPYLPSDFASRLRSAGAPLKEFYFHNNPWHCACLLELLTDLKRAGVDYVSEYTGTGPECVYCGAYPCSRQVPTGLLRRAGPGH